MTLSDDEAEDLPEFVSDYHFVDEGNEPISFSVLPFHWSSDEILSGNGKQVFVRGTTDGGLQKIYMLVRAWKFDLSRMNPEISVLSKDNHWIKLQKPKKSFESIIRTTLIMVNCLHLMKKTPEMSEKLLWDKLSKIFSLLEPRPSVNDLIDHMKLIEEAFGRDQSLSKSKFIATFLEKRPEKKKVVEEDGPKQSMKGFIIDDDGDVASDDCNDDDQMFDSVCALCDNGGRIIPCDGICMRSFHTTPEDAIKDAEEDGIEGDSICTSLGYTKKEIRAKATFTCKNCIHKQHQCFSCGRLGSSDKSSGVAEVFQCVTAACGYFYHPTCVSKLLHPDDEAAAKELAKNVGAGVPFACPSHNCYRCKKLENPKVRELQFAVCRRCPMSYHRKCLPREISFEDTEDIEQRAWEDLLHINNRILIYCLNHEIDTNLGTPMRNHLKFPGEASQKQKPSSALLPKKRKLDPEKRRLVPETKRLKQVEANTSIGKSPNFVQEGQANEKNVRTSWLPSKRKADGTDTSKQLVQKSAMKKKTVGSSLGAENKESLGMQLWEQRSKQSGSANQSKLVSEGESSKAVKTASKQSVCLEDELDRDSKKRIHDLIKEAESSITLESVYDKYNKLLSTHTISQKTMMDSYTHGRVDDLVKAIHFALQKLDDGCNVQEAKAVCPPHKLKQTINWKNKLKVYIAPFLHGSRYTSFGRHFTKVDKLKEIVDLLHWYVEDGDTVVDFGCGANDFSCLMKDKLEQSGKKCYYRNFDLFRPKNDFCFERRDWMTVQPDELPKGSKLVMGLNPPFGVHASLANAFIDKALEFKPKLIVLIVPPVTQRLDKKSSPYDLVWEDSEKLAGRAFYLPGSVDVNDKQLEDWNVVAPVLYLWSRRDWTVKHNEISEKHGHKSGKQSLVERNLETVNPNPLIEANAQVSGLEIDMETDMEIDDEPQKPVEEKKLEELIEEVVATTKDSMEDHGTNEESRGNYGISGCAQPSQKFDSKLRSSSNNPITSKEESPRSVRDTDQQRHERPSSAKPYYKKPDNFSPSDTVLRRSPQQDPSLVNRKSPLGWESPVIDPLGRPDSSELSHQRRGPGCRPTVPRHQWENENGHHLSGQHGFERHHGYLREDFGQRPLTSDMGMRYHPVMPPRPEPPSYSHASMSAMDRYAPRLDELNYGRIGNMGPPLPKPPTHSYGGMYNHQAPRPPYGGGPPPTGFAPVPRPPLPHQRSGGWLNE